MRSSPTPVQGSRPSARRFLSVTIVALYLMAMPSSITAASELATFNYDIGDRLGPFGVVDSAGRFTVLNAETPTIVVFWATWSEPSQVALASLIKGSSQSGIRWEIIPINVDGAGGSSLASISGALRRTGYTIGRLWRDPDLRLTYSWGIHTIPTVVMTGLGGFVLEMTAGWSTSFSDRVQAEHFAPAPRADSQSAGQIATEVAPTSRSVPELRRLYRQGLAAAAIDSLTRLLRVDSSMAKADVARLLLWRRERADTTGLLSLTDSLVATRPQDYWFLVNRSLQRSDRRDWQEAKLDAAGALASDSSTAPAWIMLAQASLETGDTILAREAADSAWRRNRYSPGLLELRARLATQAKAGAQFWQWAVEASMHQQKARPAGSMGAKP